jgi:hypothetical protein
MQTIVQVASTMFEPVVLLSVASLRLLLALWLKVE